MGAASEKFEHEICQSIREFAMSFPDTTEGSSCVNRAFKAGSKNFVFLGEKGDDCTVRLKLDASIPDLQKLSAAGDGYEVGTGGWAKIVFDGTNPPAMRDLEAWIAESFLLLAPKKVAAKYRE